VTVRKTVGKTVTRIKKTTRTVVKTTTITFTSNAVSQARELEAPVPEVESDWAAETSEQEAAEAPLQSRAEKSENFIELYPRNLCPVCPKSAVVRKGDGKTSGIYCCPGKKTTG
jgi:hypothetical protein